VFESELRLIGPLSTTRARARRKEMRLGVSSIMGEIRFTDQHHCVALAVSLSVTATSLYTDPDDTKIPVNGHNAVTSQITATADP
jgi:hypothetical protein